MPPALVGSAGAVSTDATGTVTPAFGQATTAGHLLVALCARSSSWGTTTTGWTVRTASTTAIGYKPNCGAGETAPTFTHSGTTGYIVLLEFSGIALSAPEDKRAISPGGATSPQVTTMPGVDAAAGELIVSTDGIGLSKAGTQTSSDTFNNGATPNLNLNNDATSATEHYRFSWGVTTSNAVADTNSVASSSMNLLVIDNQIMTFLLPAAAFVPRNSGVNHQNPGVLMEGRGWEKRNWMWLPRRPKLWCPGLATAL